MTRPEGLSEVFNDYAPAFADGAAEFLTYTSFAADKSLHQRHFTRGEFFSLALKAGGVLTTHTKTPGGFFLNCFGCNHYADLAFRLAAAMTGRTPATINWQADTLKQVVYKIETTRPELILTDPSFSPDMLAAIKTTFPAIPVYDVSALENESEMPLADGTKQLDPEDTKIVIFTSGTTGQPKGVRLPYRAYRTNQATFEKLLDISPEDRFAVLIVNPMHHTNSTALTDWAMRRPGSRIHLVQRYSTVYWKLLADTANQGYERLIAPVVARHFDFLENLVLDGKLPLELDVLKKSMAKTDFLIGSAPVGPTTVKRLKEYAGRIPVVRFGSTETCLQVLGIPAEMSDEQRLTALKKGWDHLWRGESKTGYYIGRETRPYNECRIVHSINRSDASYLQDCEPGEPGYLITRGGNVMSEYLNNPQATAEALDNGWYLGLKDICFALPAETGDAFDYYWQSRDSFMLIKGGSNYAYDQVSAELKEFVSTHFGLPETSFDLAVVGMKIDSEHEDSCCVIIETKDELAQAKRPELEASFLSSARKQVSKGAKPDYLTFNQIPKNFKGAFLVNDARKLFANFRADSLDQSGA
jgi:acyl-CoA synthetase (AMP-forming)/AMP-acid ligase II